MAPDYVVCASCGHKLAPRFTRCVHCGGDVVHAGETPPRPSARPPSRADSIPPPWGMALKEPTATPSGSGAFELADVVRHPRRDSVRPAPATVGVAPHHSTPPPAPRPSTPPLPGVDVVAGASKSRAPLWVLLTVAVVVIALVVVFVAKRGHRSVAQRLRAMAQDCDAASATIVRCTRTELSRQGRGAGSEPLVERMKQAMETGCDQLRETDPLETERQMESLSGAAADAADKQLSLAERGLRCAVAESDCAAVLECLRELAR